MYLPLSIELMNICVYLFSVSIIASIITQTRMTHLLSARPACFNRIVRIISTTIPTSSTTLAMRGSEIELQCGTYSDSGVQWNLTDRDHSRVYVQTNGNLQIKNIEPDDDGWYQCATKYESSIGGTSNNIYHHIQVFEVPSLCQTISWKYVLLECDQSLEDVYRNWALNQLLNERTHPLMEIKHVKIQCMLIEESLWELRIEIYLGFTFSTIRTGTVYAEFASIRPMADVMDNLQNVLKQFTGVDQFQRLEFLSHTFSTQLMSFCPSGSRAQFNVCLLCPPGHYSSFPATECEVCKEGFYNDKRGASQCYLCPKGTTNSIRGASSVSQCQEPWWLTALWYGIPILFGVIVLAYALGLFIKNRRSTSKAETIKRDIGKTEMEPPIDLITPKEFIVKKGESDKHLNEALTALNKPSHVNRDTYVDDNKPSAVKTPMYVGQPLELPKEAQVTRKIVGKQEPQPQQQKESNYGNVNYYYPVAEESPTTSENIYETINFDSAKVPESSPPLTNENIYENVDYYTQVPAESTPGVKTNENANHYYSTATPGATKQLTNGNSNGNVKENSNTKVSASQQHANTGETNKINQYVNVPPMSPMRKANNSQLKKQLHSMSIAPPTPPHDKPPITLSAEDNKRKQIHPIDENVLF